MKNDIEFKTVTLKHVLKAVQDIYLQVKRENRFADETEYLIGNNNARYSQEHFCGTACCVFGHAHIIAGTENVTKHNSKSYNYKYHRLFRDNLLDSKLPKFLKEKMHSGGSSIYDFVKWFKRKKMWEEPKS